MAYFTYGQWFSDIDTSMHQIPLTALLTEAKIYSIVKQDFLLIFKIFFINFLGRMF